MTCVTERREGPASQPPSSSFSSFQISADFLLHLFRSDTSINRTKTAQVAEPCLISFLPALSSPTRFDHSTFCCSALHLDSVFQHASEYFLSFTQIVSNSDTFFQLHQTFYLRVPSDPAGNAYLLFSLPEIFKKTNWPFSFLACWATSLMELPASSDIPSCSRNSVMLTFRSSLFSRYLSYPWQSLRKRHAAFACPSTATHWLSSSLDEGELCCGIGDFRVLSGTKELSPFLLGT